MEKKVMGFLGADVSKGMCNFVLQDYLGKDLEVNFQLDDNRDGHRELFRLIKKMKKNYLLKKIVVGVESTGGYENNWYRSLRGQSKELGLEVFRINPKRIYYEAKTEGRKSITDAVSAQVIAGYMRKNYGLNDLDAKRLNRADEMSGKKGLHKYIQRLIKQNTQTKNALEKHLYNSMPELLSLKGDNYSNWYLELLINYPSRDAILSTDIEELTKIKHINTGKANEIYATLEESVGAPLDEYSVIFIREQASDIQRLTRKITRLRSTLNTLVEPEMKEDIEIVTSIRGIAEDTAVGILLEIGDISRFEKGKSLIAFWGINPTIKQSGDKSHYTGMSKDGSPVARMVLYMAAKNVVIHESYFTAIYQKHRLRGKSYRSAIGVVMAKLGRVIYGMLKNSKKFDSGIDVLNQTKKPSESKSVNQEIKAVKKKERRYQDEKKKAPISMVQKSKRKKNQEQDVPS